MAVKATILLIEDEKNIRNFTATTLQAQGYKVVTAIDGKSGLSMAASICPDVILLDLGLPDIDGMDVICKIREWSGIPILVISARVQELEKAQALDAGADDYITKPFGTIELLARIRTCLRHAGQNYKETPGQVFRSGELVIDFEKRVVTVRGEEVHVTQIEFKILTLLAKNAGCVLTYSQLMREIWGPYTDDNNRILRVNMANIRRKIEENPGEPQYIYTEVGVGYRMREEDTTGI